MGYNIKVEIIFGVLRLLERAVQAIQKHASTKDRTRSLSVKSRLTMAMPLPLSSVWASVLVR